MFANLARARKPISRLVVFTAALLLAACDDQLFGQLGQGPTVNPSKPVKVGLLLPQSDEAAAPIAQSLENAARLAIADLAGVTIELSVYDTAGIPETAAEAAQAAADDGAQIILGPLFAESANAAGRAVADEGLNVLSFSNNTSIAGGNVFVLGPTFANTAERLLGFAAAQSRGETLILHPEGVVGQFSADAIRAASSGAGARVTGALAYPETVEGVAETAQIVDQRILETGATSLFITTDASNGAMPLFLQLLPENGLDPSEIQIIGLTQWNVRPDLYTYPGAQNGWFALPDQAASGAFDTRYTQAYDSGPHPRAGLAYDGIVAIGALLLNGRRDAVTSAALTQPAGFRGASGIFRLNADGTNQRGLAIAAVIDKQMVILEPAPTSFGGS
jgi:ABC-type branched-subunit amino acid transport system substrate-binding protein